MLARTLRAAVRLARPLRRMASSGSNESETHPEFNPHGVVIRAIMVGPPGSGKGTQSALIQKFFGPLPISSGQLLRDEIASGCPDGLKAQEYLAAGKLVPDDVVIASLTHQLTLPTFMPRYGWVLDGFPRTLNQAKMFDDFLASRGTKLDLVLNLHASMEEVLMRLAGRLTHLPSGRTYHPVFNPPKTPGRDDVTGEPLVVRDDDKEETIRARMQTYLDQTTPALDYYQQRGIVRRVVVDGGVPDSVFAMVRPIMVETVQRIMAERGTRRK